MVSTDATKVVNVESGLVKGETIFTRTMRRREAWSSPIGTKRRKTNKDVENGWNSRLHKTEIPQYDSRADKYNPFTHTKKFAKQFAYQKSLEEKEKRKRFVRNGKQFRAVIQNQDSCNLTTDATSYIADELPLVTSNSSGPSAGSPFLTNSRGRMSGPHGGLSFQKIKSSDPSSELEVLKSILLREGYLERLQFLVRKRRSQSQLCSEVVDMLDLIRISTVETVENIIRWKKNLTKPYPFVWNGVNYLLKISSDLDFLSHFSEVETWLGFSLVRNPFVVAECLDKRAATPIGSHAFSKPMVLTRDKNMSASAGHFHQIGSIEASVFLQAQAIASRKGGRTVDSTKNREFSGALDGKSGTAYHTPIINDADLLPISTKSSASAENLMQKTKDVTNTDMERYVDFSSIFS